MDLLSILDLAPPFDVAGAPAPEGTPADWPDGYYCTDEDIAIRAGSDFKDLIPKDQLLASGKDGVFSAADRWTLTSASVPDFASQGVTGGMVALVTLPKAGAVPDVQRLAIDPVPAAGCPLRRLGQAGGAGQPPGALAGTAGVSFVVATLLPQIDRATYELNRRYGVDDTIAGRRFADEYDPRELREACVLTVLWKQCLAASRAAQSVDSGGAGDSWAAKANRYKQELDEVLDRAVVHWKASGLTTVAPPPSTRFGMRLSR